MHQPPRRRLPGWAIAAIIGTLVPYVSVVAVVAVWLMTSGLDSLRPFGAPEPDFEGFDACSLISPEDAERAGGRPDGAGRIKVLGRVVRTTEQGVPIDTCQYGAEQRSSRYLETTLEVSVSPATVLYDEDVEGSATKPKPLSGIGDQAYSVNELFSFKVVGRRGSSQFRIEVLKTTRVNGYESTIELARKIADGVPAKLTLPATVASGPCAQIGGDRLSAVLSGPVTYSRSHRDGDDVLCSYASASGRAVTARFREKQEHYGSSFVKPGESKDIGGRQAYVWEDTITLGKTWSTRRPSKGRSRSTMRDWWVSTLVIDFADSHEEDEPMDSADFALADAGADVMLGS